jgi:hypothetical protein
MHDPTKKEIHDAVNHLDFDDFDFEAACYWFANFYHGGQSTNLYSVLSMSEYKPGMMETGPEDDAAIYDIFVEIVAVFG